MNWPLKPVLRRHPDAASLAAFCDDELSGWRHEWVARHVEGCPQCRQEVGQLRESIDFLCANAAASPSGAELRETLERLAERVGVTIGAHPNEPWRVAVEELRIYLGDHATRLDRDCREDPRKLLEAGGPLLASLLGADAAAAVESRIRRMMERCSPQALLDAEGAT